MKRVIIIALLWLVASHAFSQEPGVAFKELTLKEALAKASKESKLVFVDCYTSWCGPCAEMSKKVFPQKSCGDFMNEHFISVKFDMEKGEGAELLKKFRIQAYPTFLILDATGKEINRIIGGSTAEQFIEKVKYAMQPNNSIEELKNAYEAQKNMETGMPYVKAMIDNGIDAMPVIEYLYDNSIDVMRFSDKFMEMVLSYIRFNDPFFAKIMLDKPYLNKYMGRDWIDRLIFRMICKDMYIIAAGVGDRYNVHYTPEQVERIAYTTSLLNIPMDNAESHICRIALFVVKQDIDGMIDYFSRYICELPSSAYKGILNGILASKIQSATPSQKEKMKAYLGKVIRNYEYEVKQYQMELERIK